MQQMRMGKPMACMIEKLLLWIAATSGLERKSWYMQQTRFFSPEIQSAFKIAILRSICIDRTTFG